MNDLSIKIISAIILFGLGFIVNKLYTERNQDNSPAELKKDEIILQLAKKNYAAADSLLFVYGNEHPEIIEFGQYLVSWFPDEELNNGKFFEIKCNDVAE